jgi:RNA polymerase sigma factor (sigma-70 family)
VNARISIDANRVRKETAVESRQAFAELLEKFRAGEPAAADALLKRYTPVLREAIRRRLPQRLRSEFDSLDFVQDVWAAVCAGPARMSPLKTAEELQAYLVQVAANRVIDVFRHRSTQKSFTGCIDEPLNPTIGPEPTPSQWAMADERWESIAATLPPPHVAIVQRLREGFTQQEVSEMTGISLRTISRIVQRIQRQCDETLV